MARGKRAKDSRPSGASRYSPAEQVIAAGETQVESELRNTIAHERDPDRLTPDWIEEYIGNIVLEFTDGLPDDTVALVNEVFGVVFDPRTVGPEFLAEDPDGAFLQQIQSAYQDHLEAHLLHLIDADQDS